MKVGLLTFTDGTNIGQRLQNYALQEAVKDILPESEVLTIRQQYPFSRLKRNIKDGVWILAHPKQGACMLRRRKKFHDFNRKNITFFPKMIPFYEEVDISEMFDCFIAGSDQIWNPKSPDVSANYFLTFARPEQRIAYAPSFAVDSIPSEKKEIYQKYLEGFHRITVREDKGAEIIYNLTERNAEVVLDPTFLINSKKYDTIIIPSKLKPNCSYILVLFLGEKPTIEINYISQKMNLEMIQLDSMSPIGPDEFLDLIKDANMVLTDSYHVTVFSVIYHRPFINFERKGTDICMMSRFDTLYRILGIRDRSWNYMSKHEKDWQIIDYEMIDNNIRVERERCRKILMNDLYWVMDWKKKAI